MPVELTLRRIMKGEVKICLFLGMLSALQIVPISSMCADLEGTLCLLLCIVMCCGRGACGLVFILTNYTTSSPAATVVTWTCMRNMVIAYPKNSLFFPGIAVSGIEVSLHSYVGVEIVLGMAIHFRLGIPFTLLHTKDACTAKFAISALYF